MYKVLLVRMQMLKINLTKKLGSFISSCSAIRSDGLKRLEYYLLRFPVYANCNEFAHSFGVKKKMVLCN